MLFSLSLVQLQGSWMFPLVSQAFPLSLIQHASLFFVVRVLQAMALPYVFSTIRDVLYIRLLLYRYSSRFITGNNGPLCEIYLPFRVHS